MHFNASERKNILSLVLFIGVLLDTEYFFFIPILQKFAGMVKNNSQMFYRIGVKNYRTHKQIKRYVHFNVCHVHKSMLTKRLDIWGNGVLHKSQQHIQYFYI